MRYFGSFVASTMVLAAAVNATMAANSATVVSGSLTQGSVKASMSGNSYALETNNLSDWPLTTSSTLGISLTNANFNGTSFGGSPNSVITFGDGGGLTLKFGTAIKPVAGEKEFGIFTAQMLGVSSGSIFNGNMEAAILVSADNQTWYTLGGQTVATPTSYTQTSYTLNAPTMAYNYGTTATAWTYGSPGTTAANLAALTTADYQTPMPDDNLFNGTGTNADRLLLKTNSSATTYSSLFGTSGGGNWFDISASGLSEVSYVRLNGINCGGTSGGVRLDAVFTTPQAMVPEPVLLSGALIAGCGLLARRRGSIAKLTTCDAGTGNSGARRFRHRLGRR